MIMKLIDLLEDSTADIDDGYRETLPPSFTSPSMDQYYEYYRFLVAIAGMPENGSIPTNGPIKDGPYIVPYSKIERDHSIELLKKMGKSVEFVTSKPSMEPSSTGKASPVRKFVDMDKDK